MIIHSIKNRTENWKTAKTFVPLMEQGIHRLARILGEDKTVPEHEVHMQLFWKGMRDHSHENPKPYSQDEVAKRFNSLFPNLRNHVKAHAKYKRKFEDLIQDNYRADTEDQKRKLLSNLLHTEIDIVVESPHSLFIGEAKYQMSFDANRKLILVHQLIRQYVMAKILAEIVQCPNMQRPKEVIPFIVGGSKRSLQVDFLIDQGWLKESNILNWEEIEALEG